MLCSKNVLLVEAAVHVQRSSQRRSISVHLGMREWPQEKTSHAKSNTDHTSNKSWGARVSTCCNAGNAALMGQHGRDRKTAIIM